METIRQLADRRVEEKLPLDIIVVTSTNDLRSLKGVLADKGVKDDPVLGVTYAGTPLHGAKVYGLGGVKTAEGKTLSYMALKDLARASASQLGSYPIAMGDIDDPAAVQAWWYVANGEFGALKQIAKVARKKSELGDQCQALLQRAITHLETRYTGISLPLSTIGDYEAAEQLYADIAASGLRELSEQEKALKSALKEADRDDALQDELKARAGYQTCLGMLASDKMKQQTDGVLALRQLAELLPNTVYGKKAKTRAAAYSGH